MTISTFIVSSPTLRELPITAKSPAHILEPYHVDLLGEYGYVQRDYLISGVASGAPYTTRILLRCPADPSRFSGVVVEEISHLWGGTSVWRAINRWLMRNGHAWLEVDSQAPPATGHVKASNPARYGSITFLPAPDAQQFQSEIPFTPNPTRQTLEDEYTSFMKKWWEATPQSPEILVAASHALRSGQLGITASRVFLSGLSQTGGVTRRFITHSSNLRLPNGKLPFEGFVPCASGGAALPDVPGAKIIELLGEAEFQSVRWACGVSGQARGTSHRRVDSEGFRLYEVAGMAHREIRWPSDLDVERLKDCELHGAEWSSFPNSFIHAAVWEFMIRWTDPSSPSSPPPSLTLNTLGSTDEIVRDEHGNALGGVRSLHVEVPISRVVAATPMGRPSWYCGSEFKFDAEKMKELYGNVLNYRRVAGQELLRGIDQGWLLPCDAEVLRRETIEKVSF